MRPRVWLALALLLVPLAEIAVLIRVGQVIGPWWTILLLIAMSMIGSWLIRREWRGTWQALNDSIGTGRVPTRELLDGGLVIAGGLLLLIPGFISDLVGFLILLPLTRPLFRRIALWLIASRVQSRVVTWTGGLSGFGLVQPPAGSSARVVQGEVLDDQPGARTDSSYPPV